MSKAYVDSKLEDHTLSFLRSQSVDCHINFQFEYPAIHELYPRILDSFFAFCGACSHQQRETRISSVISVLRFSWRRKSIKFSLADISVRWTIESNISETKSNPIITVIWNGITLMMEMDLVSEMLDFIIRLNAAVYQRRIFRFVRSVRLSVRTDKRSSHWTGFH